MKTVALLGACALCCAATASASFTPSYWPLRSMTTAIRAVGYPHPHPKTLHCTADQHARFKCKATYSHNRKATFAIFGVGTGGWLCGGKTWAGCKILKHGFVTSAFVKAFGDLGKVAQQAANSYLSIRNQNPHTATQSCQQQGTALTWACSYTVNSNAVTVTVTFAQARGGYVTTGSEA